ncbi:lysophospholipase-like protein 1 isoform X2 [Anabrus simplex]|uniref:lysophospholipase-like protein 1 isoform X2 n=1 Tax=Anabrus simplex TaxID=316456 RepID=UPI0034DD396D
MAQRSHAWFNRPKVSLDAPEDLTTIDSMAQELSVLVNKEVEQGIPLNRIIVGGFSNGGTMALHLAYRYLPQLSGVFALSTFLNHNSSVYEALQMKTTQELPPLFMCHGDQDGLVSDEWASQTANTLQKLGVDVQFHIIKDADHELTKRELLQLMDWISEKLPPLGELST